LNEVTATIVEVNGAADTEPSNSNLTTSILVNSSIDYIPLREEFAMLTWPVINPTDGTKWELGNSNFSPSASFRAFNAPDSQNESWLVTPVLDFSSAATASMFFDLSYAWNGADNDRLKILASTDCGDTYQSTLPPFDKSGANLANATSTAAWQPNQADDWQLNQYMNLSAYAGEQQVRIAFVFHNQAGNNIFLDNIEFFVSDDPAPVEAEPPFSVYWNSGFNASVTFNLQERSPVRFMVMDVMGRIYFDAVLDGVLNQTYPVDLQNAAEGIYIIRSQIGARFYSTKVFIAGSD
jgi:hypothetical protein